MVVVVAAVGVQMTASTEASATSSAAVCAERANVNSGILTCKGKGLGVCTVGKDVECSSHATSNTEGRPITTPSTVARFRGLLTRRTAAPLRRAFYDEDSLLCSEVRRVGLCQPAWARWALVGCHANT